MSDDDMLWDDDDPVDSDDDSVAVENQYFTSKDLMDQNIGKAISGFERVLEMEKELSGERGEWSFKALKRLVKLEFTRGNFDKVTEHYTQLLKCSSFLTPDQLFRGINKVLDLVSNSDSTDLILKLYDKSLNSMKAAKNESTWFKTKYKLAKLLFDKKEWAKLTKILEELLNWCKGSDGNEDPKKASQILDIFSLDIQMSMERKNKKETQELYNKALDIAKKNPGILNSRLAIFHFCGGKILMEQREWEKAHSSFHEAFRFFEEAGQSLRIPCLKYILLANMLLVSDIDPFDSPEAKNLRHHAEIEPMANLLVTYQNNAIHDFEQILRQHNKTIMGDPFIRSFMDDLLREMRTQVLLQLIKPYTRIRIGFLAKELNIKAAEVESLLVDLILDNKIVGKIDQVNQLLSLESSTIASSSKKYRAMNKWAEQLSTIQNNLLSRAV
eukprot:TRINITY_DN1723_c0_g1_i2.p1 TRINITY_DN1723_c0_g1~~TRINITY_DN1723_c0_g1_i2.p1  ORF type:complete len:442 (-),score=97.43 TRINITY_DN1723_c0_g1_i2:256-1581(-)